MGSNPASPTVSQFDTPSQSIGRVGAMFRGIGGGLIALLLLTGCASSPGTQEKPSEATPDTSQDSQIAAFEPVRDWSLDFDRMQLMHSALEVTHAFFEASDDRSANDISYYFEDSVSEWRIKTHTNLVAVTAQAFSDYAFDETTVIAGTTQQFMTNTLINNDLEYPDGKVVSLCGIAVWEDLASGCNWQNMVWMGFGEEPEGEVLIVGPHEMFHTVQANLAGGTPTLGTMPNWLIEGGSEFMGYAVTDYTGDFAYEDLAHRDWHYLPNPATGLKFWAIPPGSRNIPFEQYMLGQVATEYLISNLGMESYLQIFSNMGEGLEFDEAFDEATGMTITKFYALFDIAYANMLKKDTGDFRTFENRICPERFNWNCEIDNYKGLEWYMLLGAKVELPDEPENSDHGLPTERWYIDYTHETCADLRNMGEFDEETGAIAVSFEAASQLEYEVVVSTQWYARQNHLDTNLDGLACGPGDEGA